MKSPAFQYYPGDFLSDINTMVMSAEEIGAYWLLCSVYWIEHGLPDDMALLSSIARLPIERFTQAWQTRIEKCFPRDSEGRFTHPRLDKERQKQEHFKAKKAESGRVGASKRWGYSKPKRLPSQKNGKTISAPDSTPILLPMANDSSSSSSSSSSSDNNTGGEISLKRQLTDLWCERFKLAMGAPYKFNGAADGKAADDLLKLGISKDEILAIAEKAWRNKAGFWSKHAITIVGLYSKFNQVREEVGAFTSNGVKKSLKSDWESIPGGFK